MKKENSGHPENKNIECHLAINATLEVAPLTGEWRETKVGH